MMTRSESLVLDQTAEARRAVLEQVLTGVPYNSASQFHQHFGTREIPLRVGVSCALQSFEAGRLVESQTGVKASYLPDGRHVAAVYYGQNQLTVLDPYLMHREPLLLELADEHEGVISVTAEAYPIRTRKDGTPAPAKVRARWLPAEDEIRLEYVRFSPRRGHNIVSRAFTLRGDRALSIVPPPPEVIRPLLTHPEQNNLSIRAVVEDAGLREVVLPLTGRSPGEPVNQNRLLTKDNNGAVSRAGTAGFTRDLELVAGSVRWSPGEVVEFLREAAAIYDRVAPAGLQLPDYSDEDE
jgi:hypothetical protein